MVRKAPATTKNKGSNKDETYIPGLTDSADVIQQFGDPRGIALDKSIASAAQQMKPDGDLPEGGLNSEIAAPINSK